MAGWPLAFACHHMGLRNSEVGNLRHTQTAALLLLIFATVAGCSQLSPARNGASAPRAGTALASVGSPVAGTGSIRGRLVVESTGKPFAGTLYLGRAVKASQAGVPPLIAFSEASDPQTQVDQATGSFEFTGLPPGTYSPIVWSPTGGTVLHPAGSSEPISIEVHAGQVTDAGTIRIR